jgi:hypothetical protein
MACFVKVWGRIGANVVMLGIVENYSFADELPSNTHHVSCGLHYHAEIGFDSPA